MIRFTMLLINNNRSKAYLQNLVLNGFIPESIVVLDDTNVLLPEHTDNDATISKDTTQKFVRSLKDLNIGFDEKEHILTTIKKSNIYFELVKSLDVNSPEVVNAIKKTSAPYMIYSGPGGTILRKDILSAGPKFIHVHPGWLPDFKGSTTIYYSMLINSEVGASVIFFEEGIDEGPVLFQRKYKITERDIDFDYVLDPLVRTKTLIEFFRKGELNHEIQEKGGNTYFIIHPLLKHCAIISHKSKS